jgi:hypothetical protein
MTVSDEMTCEEFRETAPAYALAVLDEMERTACTRHLAHSGPHRGCEEALEEARQVTARLSAAVPARPPSPGLWRAIEARIADVPTGAVDRRRRPRERVREIAGWVVAAVVIALSLVSTLADRGRRAAAVDGHRSTAREAIGLMTVPGTRVVAFIPRKTGVGRATLIVNRVQHRALLLADQIPPEAAPRLRLWGARGPNVPIPLAAVSFVAADGIAAADLGSSLFEPAPPDQLVLSADGPDAMSPGDVLLTAETR